MSAFESLAEGDSLYFDGNIEGAVDRYTVAVCSTDPRKAPAENEDTPGPSNKVTRFRSFSHRSEAYLAQRKYPHAYNDANSALSLFPPSDTIESTGLRPEELPLAHHRIARGKISALVCFDPCW